MRRLVVNSIVVGSVLPLRVAAWAARGLGADRSAARLRALTAGVPIAAYVVTGVVWFFLLHSGIFYPPFDAGDLQGSLGWAHPRRSMGSPSCPCSWAAFGRRGSLRPLESREARPFTHTAHSHSASPNQPDPKPTRASLEARERSCTERRKKR